jgi:hypothetical protein
MARLCFICKSHRWSVKLMSAEPSETYGYMRSVAEALACLFHVLLLDKIGMPRDVLTKLMTKSIIAERLIKPALGEVGLEIASDKT